MKKYKIPVVIKKITNKFTKEYKTFDYQYTTDNLVVYKDRKTGVIECWRKKDFLDTEIPKDKRGRKKDESKRENT